MVNDIYLKDDVISYYKRHDDWMKITKFRIFAVFSVLYAALIFYLSSLSSISIPVQYIQNPQIYQLLAFLEQNSLSFIADFIYYCYYNTDKVAHVILYFGFGILLHLTFRNSKYTVLRKYAAIVAIVVGILYGITDEFHQSYVPGRVASTADLLANGIGVTIAQIVILILVAIKLVSMKRKSTDQNDSQD